MKKFSELKFIDRSKIATAPKIFQGRQESFSQATVNKIAGEGYDKSEPPIVVW